MAQLPLPMSFYEDRSLPISAQNLVNFYVNMVRTEGGLSKVTYYGSPGLVQLATTGSTAAHINRGAWSWNDKIYLVNGDNLYSLDRSLVGTEETFSTTSIGSISGEGRVSIASNDSQLMILVPGGTGYIYDGTTLSEISDGDFTASGNPEYVVYNDGYFICNTDDKKWIISNLNDGTAWDALDFSTAESDPDKIVAPVVTNNRVYIVGSETTEEFENIGGQGFPYQRTGMFLDKGCKAPFTLINANRSFFMVGAGKRETPAIWMFRGNDYIKISTPAIEYVLAEMTDTEINNAFAMSYSLSGAYYVIFTFPEITFEYNMETNQWNERKSFYNDNNSKWRVNAIVEGYGRIIATDAVDGRVGELSLDEYGEYGNDIHSYFTMAPFFNGGNPITNTVLELTCESGVGNDTVSDPQIFLQRSDDPRTIDNARRRNRSLGQIGEYKKRQIWRRNGRFSKYSIFRFGIVDQCKKVIIRADVS